MNKLWNKLPLLALMLAGTLAFGFNAPEIVVKKTATRMWTPGGSLPHGYRDVTTIVNNGSYNCNSQPQECVVQFSNDNPATGIKTVLESGAFASTL